jgi:hypothetical protein
VTPSGWLVFSITEGCTCARGVAAESAAMMCIGNTDTSISAAIHAAKIRFFMLILLFGICPDVH